MGDSDDEYDRKRRDKFRGERTEYRGGEGRREERRSGTMGSSAPRDDWSESAPPPRKMDKGYPEYDPYEAKRLKERANSFQSYQGTRSSESWGGGGGGGGGRNRVATSYPDYRQSSGPPGRSSSGNGSRDRYSPPSRSHELSQPIKRARTDWGEERRYMPEPSYGGGGGYTNNPWGPPPPEGHYGHPGGPYGGHGSNRDVDMGQTQPAMMSFKSFLQTQDDNISDEEAINKYNEYKLEFKRQQLNDFFVNHKDEEWFKIKYHPEDSVKRKDEQMTALKNRVSVFLEFLDKERFSSVTVDADQSEALVKLLDSVVIRLEGGTEFDLEVLEQAVNQVATSQQQQQQQTQQSEPPVNPRSKELALKTEEGSFTPPPRSDSTEESGAEKVVEKAESPESHTPPPVSEDKEGEGEEGEEESKDEPAEGEKEEGMETETAKPEVSEPVVEKPVQLAGKKRKREYDFESGSDSADDMDDEPQRADDPDELVPPGEESEDRAKSPLENGNKSVKHRGSDDEDEAKSEHGGTEKKEGEEGSMDTSREEGEAGAEDQLEKPKQEEKEETPEPEEPKPRALHKTASIFLRNLAPTITKQEVEAMCKRYPGFLRVAIADPQPERRWFRRGWVTFERHVNIKEICWNLNNIRLRDCELGAIVNRDLSRRVRTVNGITSHKQVVRHDIKVAARIVQNLDEKIGLWTEPGQKSTQSDIPSFGLVSKNPVLKNITDYLIEEASAEEEELLGQASSVDAVSADGAEPGEQTAQSSGGSTVERDDTLLEVLDRLLFYLRIVHSVDYYNHCEYPNEDEMPNRCGIMHARGIPPSSKVTQQEITDYCTTFEQKIASFLQPATKITEEDLQKLGAKDPEAEVEKFVVANTQELAKDKWLCPLSGKKFKGADFVRKHIFNKHGEKVDEVKKEVEYFNNYLRDPKRPQLPEHPGNRSQKRDGPSERDGYNSGGGGYMPQYGGGYNNYGSGGGGGMNSRGYNNYTSGYGGGGPTYNREPYHREPYSRPHRGGHYGNRGNRGGDYRPVIHYRDLDAPREPEEF